MYDIKALIAASPLIPGGGLTSYQLNAANLKYDIAFQPTASFTLAKINFRVTSVTGSPTFTAQIQTDNGSGVASGTLAWTNATISTVATGSGGWVGETALTASGTVSPGTLYHLVITNDNGTPASNFFSVQDQSFLFLDGTYGWSQSTQYAWPASYNGTTWAVRTGSGPIFALSDGTTIQQGQVFDGGTNVQGLSSTTAYGIKFVAAASGNLWGVNFQHLPQTGIGTVTAKLYNTSDTLLGTATLATGAATLFASSGRNAVILCFNTGPVAITSGSSYRLVFNDSGSSDRIEYFTAPSTPNDYRTVAPFAQDVQWTQGTTGAWTDTPGKLMAGIYLVMSSVSSGGSNPANSDVRNGVANGAGSGTLVVPAASQVAATTVFDNGTVGTYTSPPDGEALAGDVYGVGGTGTTGTAAGGGPNPTVITFTSDGTTPIVNASVWVTSDSAGLVPITGVLQSDGSGHATFNLTTGTVYYANLEAAGYRIRNQAFTA